MNLKLNSPQLPGVERLAGGWSGRPTHARGDAL